MVDEHSDSLPDGYIGFLQTHIRDLRTVLETLHGSEPWVPRDEFKQAFTENDLGQLYDDMFGDADRPEVGE